MRPRRPRSTPAGGHRPVLPAAVLAALDPRPGDVVVDCTLGAAGHAVELLRRVGPAGLLIGLDLDANNLPPARERLAAVGHPFHLHHGNFAGLPQALAAAGLPAARGPAAADAVLADLGVSSMQIDDPGRGFSFMRDGPLDMRMDPARGRTAAELLATLPRDELAAAFRDLGDCDEIKPGASEAIADAVVRQRRVKPLERTGELMELVKAAVPVKPVFIAGKKRQPTARQQQLRPVAQVFQALRILVNRELANLTQLLRVLPDVLKPGGRAAVISFHSGEDRLVKAAFRDGLRAGVYAAVSEEPVRADYAERGENPRSRSAKLRWALKRT
jgi:16S rRNA (cytosine1402-N4)-methyltransferase